MEKLKTVGLYGKAEDFVGLYGKAEDFVGLYGKLEDFVGLYGKVRDFFFFLRLLFILVLHFTSAGAVFQ